jgi:hypothetical protein
MPWLPAQLDRITLRVYQVFMHLDYFQCADQSIREDGVQLDQMQISWYSMNCAKLVEKERSAPVLKTLLYQN